MRTRYTLDQDKQLQIPTCRECGYNLTGLKGDVKCPECGWRVDWVSSCGRRQHPISLKVATALWVISVMTIPPKHFLFSGGSAALALAGPRGALRMDIVFEHIWNSLTLLSCVELSGAMLAVMAMRWPTQRLVLVGRLGSSVAASLAIGLPAARLFLRYPRYYQADVVLAPIYCGFCLLLRHELRIRSGRGVQGWGE